MLTDVRAVRQSPVKSRYRQVRVGSVVVSENPVFRQLRLGVLDWESALGARWVCKRNRVFIPNRPFA
jgi:hypothetical protein